MKHTQHFGISAVLVGRAWRRIIFGLLAISATAFPLALEAPACQAGQVVFIQGGKGDSVSQGQLDLVARFYGLELKTSHVRARADALQALGLLRNSETLAAVVSADVLPAFLKADVISSLRRPNARNVPLLILGVTPQTDAIRLASWSDSALPGCQPVPAGLPQGTLRVGNASEVTRELAGEEIPNVTRPTCTFAGNAGRGMQPLVSYRSGEDDRPIFVWHNSGSGKTFFLTDLKIPDSPARAARSRKAEDFSPLAPLMMFVRYAAGERAWHSDGHYANLTIDDAWLTQPYGHLDYLGLLAEMEKHSFHTTIAFIPWNFDRSDPKVVQLFCSHSDRFSICIHGNNHSHSELASYNEKPLLSQASDIRQALARMEKFQSLTTLQFDRFMIFPYEVVSPVPTLRKLEEYNFLAAANAVTVPVGSAQPVDPLWFFRAVTLEFASFPLVRRYSAEGKVPKPLIAVNAFLENPLLFYGHHTLFTNGIGAFDPIADAINQIQPDVRWSSLGSVAQHLYLERLRNDTEYDVLAFSKDFILQNKQQRHVVFHVQEQEDGSPAIKSLTLDGQPVSYELSGGILRFTVPAGSGAAKHVVIKYQNDLNLASVDVSKKGLYVAFLRKISDFRDITLSRYAFGRTITRFYYQNRLDDLKLEAEESVRIFVVLAVVSIVAGLLLRKRLRARKWGSTAGK